MDAILQLGLTAPKGTFMHEPLWVFCSAAAKYYGLLVDACVFVADKCKVQEYFGDQTQVLRRPAAAVIEEVRVMVDKHVMSHAAESGAFQADFIEADCPVSFDFFKGANLPMSSESEADTTFVADSAMQTVRHAPEEFTITDEEDSMITELDEFVALVESCAKETGL